MTLVCLSGFAAVIEQWDMSGNGQWQNSNNGLNIGGHYNTNNHALAQTSGDSTFLYSPNVGTGYGGKSALTAPIDLTQGVVTLSMAFTAIDWSGTSGSNNNIGFRLYESAAADAEYVGLQFLDNSDRIRVRMEDSVNGTSANFGRYGADLTASGTYNAMVEIDYANNEIRLSGAWDWNTGGGSSGVQTNSFNFAAAGFTSIGNFQTRYANWSSGDTMLVDDITISQVIPEPATLGMIAVFGGGILFIRRRFKI